MLKIGITGIIGSGKSTVAGIFAALGIPVYDSDIRAKQLTSTVLRDQLTAIVGDKLFDCDGQLDKRYFAGRLFSEPGLKVEVEKVVHPAVANDFLKWADGEQSPYVMLESALLFSSPAFSGIIDLSVVVSCPVDLALKRAMRRDGASSKEVDSRMSRQMSAQQMLQNADYVISTDENELLTPKVVTLSNIFINFANDF